jgi:hypothetical protein
VGLDEGEGVEVDGEGIVGGVFEIWRRLVKSIGHRNITVGFFAQKILSFLNIPANE